MREASRKRTTIRSWFNLGESALKRVLPAVPAGYACPICWGVFSREEMENGALSLEHAPAANLGGKAVALTCAHCNSSAGTKLDAHAVARERHLDFFSGTLDGSLPITLQSGELSLNAEASSIGRNIIVKGDPKRNPPGTGDAWNGYVEQWVPERDASGLEYHVRFKKSWNERAAHLAALRAGYLLAFSALGYSYILSRILRAVHEQLLDLDTKHIRVFSIIDPRAARDVRRMVIVSDPTELRSLMVQFGRSIVFLPWVDNGIYAKLAQDADAGPVARLEVRGEELAWPVRPVFALDFAGSQ